MIIHETERLAICKTGIDDANFILELFNDPEWLKYLGDRNIRDLEDARNYIEQKPLAQYQKWGFGMFITRLKDCGTPIGICGLMKRDFLDHVDVGFALLSNFTGNGYATESVSALLTLGITEFGLDRVVAIADSHNKKSIRVLEKVGLKFDRIVTDPKDGEDCQLYT